MAKNQFKTESTDNQKTEEKVKKKKKKIFKSGGEKIKATGNFFKDDRTKNVIGIFFILFSAILLIALSSFLFTWEADQSKLEVSISDFLFNADLKAENWLGKFGAAISHLFIFKWFGVASFLFVGLFFLIGFKILFKISLLPLGKSFRISFFLIIFLSLLLSFFFNQFLFYLGGGFGFFINQWLQSILGYVGTGFLITFAFLCFLVISFNVSFSNLFNTQKEEDVIDAENTDSISDDQSFSENLVTDQYNKEDESADASITAESADDEDNMEGNPSDAKTMEGKEQNEVELSKEIPEEPTKEATDDDGFSYEVAEEEATVAVEEKEAEKSDDDISLEIEDTEEDDELSDDELDSRVKEFGEYDSTLDLPHYKTPPIDILKDYGGGSIKVDKEELENNKNRIVKTLENYNIKIDSIKATVGPTVTLYEIIPAPGVRISKIKNLEDDIALSLAALGIRIIAPIPGKGTIGIEVPNRKSRYCFYAIGDCIRKVSKL